MYITKYIYIYICIYDDDDLLNKIYNSEYYIYII